MANETEIVSVVAGGWSVSQVDLAKIPGKIIGINDSAMYLPRVDAIVSMDRKWTEARADWLIERGLSTYLRRGTIPATLNGFNWITPYKCDNESVAFGPCVQAMNGTNSGYVGLNLAYIWWPKKLYLFGFDMRRGPNNEAHWYPNYHWNPKASSGGKLKEWRGEIRTIAEQFARKKIEVINVSQWSAIDVWPRLSPEKL